MLVSERASKEARYEVRIGLGSVQDLKGEAAKLVAGAVELKVDGGEGQQTCSRGARTAHHGVVCGTEVLHLAPWF